MNATPTAATIARHELAGLRVRVAASTDPTTVDVEGTVLDETEGTLLVETDEGRTLTLPKAESTFVFELEDETVLVDGERLVADPARRTETRGESPWR